MKKRLGMAMGCLLLAGLFGGCEGPGKTNWEYKCWESDRENGQIVGFETHLETAFNEMGREGWEMVGYGMNNGANVRYVCFKRPLGY